ncbi:MAG: pyrroloquinoline quinone-dependent dehydrogenase [Acidobacteriota bacterium]
MRWAGLTASVVLLLAAWLAAQTSVKSGEWQHYGADLANTHYSPLDQITATNFNRLQIAWRFKTDNLGPSREGQLEATPLMVNGMLYSTGGTRRAVIALNATTGELKWIHSEDEGERGANAPRQLSGRGLAYWTDGTQERILYVTPGYRLIALDAKTGARVSGFGIDGIVDLKLDDDQAMDLVTGEVGLHSTPVVARNVVIVGAAHRSGGVPRVRNNVRGFVRGFDVKTGKRLWIFHTIPRPGEAGFNTWENDSAGFTGNAGSWGQISVDEQLGLAYLPIELPTGDYYGGHRPGNNLFGESLVAVDLETGARRWHYQLVHHGIWDFDIPCAPILIDITVNGRAIKAVAQPTKQAWVYVLNRETGEPVWPINERPVPNGEVPGEWYSPTQPYPSKPPAYDRQGLSLDDLIDWTPALRAEAEKRVARYRIGPIFTPPVLSKIDGPLATLALAATSGGTNWQGGSYDPETHILYAPSQRSVSVMGLVPPPPDVSDMNFVQGSALTGARRSGGAGAEADADRPSGGPAAELAAGSLVIDGLPIIKPPYGSITAINMDRGEIVWQVAHGETPDEIRNHAALKGLTIPRTGRAGNFGVLVTKTLAIAGEAGTFTNPQGQKGAMLRAYDKATGREMGAVFMAAPQSGTPMTYMFNGRQYIVVAISGGGYSGEFVAYRLPANVN